MSEQTNIAWCHHTWNPWIGCTKLAGGKVEGTLVRADPACFHCYAAEQDHFRYSRTLGAGTKEKPVSHWGHHAPRHITKTWDEPIKWNRQMICVKCGKAEFIGSDDCRHCGTNFSDENRARARVFCGSLCDWADCEVSDEIRSRAFDVIDQCPNLDWMLLSKREQKAVEFLTARYGPRLPDHLWLGFSAGTQAAFDIRSEAMSRVQARVKFFSFEPLFEDINLSKNHCTCWFSINTGPQFECERCGQRRLMLQLGIYGGESGPGARPQNVQFIRSGVEQCRQRGISPFVKQLGAFPVWPTSDMRGPANLRDKKGGDMTEWPEDLRVREMPKV